MSVVSQNRKDQPCDARVLIDDVVVGEVRNGYFCFLEPLTFDEMKDVVDNFKDIVLVADNRIPNKSYLEDDSSLYDEGHEDGYESGYQDGVKKGYLDGKASSAFPIDEFFNKLDEVTAINV